VTSLPRLEEVLGAAVRANELRLATVTGVVFDARWERLLGLEATGRDGIRRFLPWVAAELHGGVVGVVSPFVLLDTGELDGYVRLGAMVVRDRMQLAGLGVGTGGEITRADRLAGVSQEVTSGIEIG
jgi:hypothetical protein